MSYQCSTCHKKHKTMEICKEPTTYSLTVSTEDAIDYDDFICMVEQLIAISSGWAYDVRPFTYEEMR